MKITQKVVKKLSLSQFVWKLEGISFKKEVSLRLNRWPVLATRAASVSVPMTKAVEDWKLLVSKYSDLQSLDQPDTSSLPAIIRGMPPHWMNEPHQELAPAVLEVTGSFLPPTPPRAPPSQVVVVDLLPLQGVWWDLHSSYCSCTLSPLRLLLGWSCPSPSSPRTILTLRSAGCRCSAFELRRLSAVEVAIFTASVFCRESVFLWTDWTWMSKCSMFAWTSGWKISKCL